MTPLQGRTKLADREGFLAPLFLLPAVVYIIALVAFPLLLALAFAFSDVTVGRPSFDWVGLRNFDRIFDDPVFWSSLRNTLIFTMWLWSTKSLYGSTTISSSFALSM